jgi:hypothetical protein
MKRMKTLSILALFLFPLYLKGQSLDRSVVASSGTYVQVTGLSVSSTIGEAAVTTLSGASSILTQGFQQPDGLFVGIVDVNTGRVSLQAWPNPVSTDLTLEILSPDNSKVQIRCLDILGRDVLPVKTEDLRSSEPLKVNLDLRQLIPAMYFVRVSKTGKQDAETLRIIKSH